MENETILKKKIESEDKSPTAKSQSAEEGIQERKDDEITTISVSEYISTLLEDELKKGAIALCDTAKQIVDQILLPQVEEYLPDAHDSQNTDKIDEVVATVRNEIAIVSPLPSAPFLGHFENFADGFRDGKSIPTGLVNVALQSNWVTATADRIAWIGDYIKEQDYTTQLVSAALEKQADGNELASANLLMVAGVLSSFQMIGILMKEIKGWLVNRMEKHPLLNPQIMQLVHPFLLTKHLLNLISSLDITNNELEPAAVKELFFKAYEKTCDHFNQESLPKDHEQARELSPNDSLREQNLLRDIRSLVNNEEEPNNRAQQLEDAWTLFNENKFEEAIAVASEVLGLESTSARAYRIRGNSYYSLGDIDHALLDYEKAVELDSNDDTNYYNRAVVLFLQEDYQRALSDLNIISCRNADYSPARELQDIILQKQIDIALDLYNNERFQDAIAFTTQLIQLYPDSVDAHCIRANSFYSLNELDDALFNYEKVIELDPSNDENYYNKAATFFRQKNYHQALDEVDEILQRNPEHALAKALFREILQHQLDIARELYKRNIFEGARAVANQVMGLDADFADAYRIRGNSYHAVGDLENALSDYQKAVELDPSDDTNYYNRAMVYSGLGDYPRALEDLNKILQRNPDHGLAKELQDSLLDVEEFNIIKENHATLCQQFAIEENSLMKAIEAHNKKMTACNGAIVAQIPSLIAQFKASLTPRAMQKIYNEFSMCHSSAKGKINAKIQGMGNAFVNNHIAAIKASHFPTGHLPVSTVRYNQLRQEITTLVEKAIRIFLQMQEKINSSAQAQPILNIPSPMTPISVSRQLPKITTDIQPPNISTQIASCGQQAIRRDIKREAHAHNELMIKEAMQSAKRMQAEREQAAAKAHKESMAKWQQDNQSRAEANRRSSQETQQRTEKSNKEASAASQRNLDGIARANVYKSRPDLTVTRFSVTDLLSV